MINRISFINACAVRRTDADHMCDRFSTVTAADKPVATSAQA
ncbi:hypothetical protein [Vibrio sp. 10N]